MCWMDLNCSVMMKEKMKVRGDVHPTRTVLTQCSNMTATAPKFFRNPGILRLSRPFVLKLCSFTANQTKQQNDAWLCFTQLLNLSSRHMMFNTPQKNWANQCCCHNNNGRCMEGWWAGPERVSLFLLQRPTLWHKSTHLARVMLNV